MNEWRTRAYDNLKNYKERIKRWHDRRIVPKEFKEGDKVLLLNLRLRLMPGKLRSKWSGPYEITQVFSYGVCELKKKDGTTFKVNGHRLKLYLGNEQRVVEAMEFEE